MKKWIKKFGIIWLGALALGWEIKEGIAQTTQDTNNHLQTVLVKEQDKKIDKSKTYVVPTVADLQRQKEKQTTIDSVKITEAIIMLNTHADKLIKFYGKEKLSKKISQVMKEHPDFWELNYTERKSIIEAAFADFFGEQNEGDIVVWVIIALFVVLNIAGYLKQRRFRKINS